MTDAIKYRIMRTALLLIALFILLWIIVQLAIGTNAAAELDEKNDRCLMSADYGDCMEAN